MNSGESIKRLRHIIEVVKDKKASNNEYVIDLYDTKCLEEILNQIQQLKEENKDLKNKLEDNTKIYLNTSKYASEVETKYYIAMHGWNEEIKERIKICDKYDKALELLIEYNMPCEIDEFMDKNTDYCNKNCGVDEEILKKCWDRFIIQKIGGSNE